MKKLKLYFDTSVLNFAIATDVPDERQTTLKLFEEVNQGKHEVFISDVVIQEINRAPEPIASRLKTIIVELNAETLPITEDSAILAEKYIENGIIPKKYDDDAMHIAIASANDLDVIVSWNFNHIVRADARINSQILGVEAPVRQGARSEHTRRYVNDEQRSRTGCIGVQKWEVILAPALKVKTKRAVAGVNLLMGYREIDIYSPKEVIGNVE